MRNHLRKNRLADFDVVDTSYTARLVDGSKGVRELLYGRKSPKKKVGELKEQVRKISDQAYRHITAHPEMDNPGNHTILDEDTFVVRTYKRHY